MATGKKDADDGGRVGRLAERGEEAVTKLFDELGRNPRVTDALGKAMAAKGRIDTTTRTALGSIGLAASDEIRELRKQLERLEKRLAKLEGGGSSTRGGSARSTKTSETKRTPTTRKRTTTTSTGQEEEEKTPSPAPGRALGGGTGRGSTPSGGAAA